MSVGDPDWLVNEAATESSGGTINKTYKFKNHAGGTFVIGADIHKSAVQLVTTVGRNLSASVSTLVARAVISQYVTFDTPAEKAEGYAWCLSTF